MAASKIGKGVTKKMRKNVLAKSFALGVAACVCMTCSVWAAAPEAEAVEEETTVAAAAEAAEATEAAPAEAPAEGYMLNITNKTGDDITYLNVYAAGSDEDPAQLITLIQEALIEQKFLDDVADGSFGPKSEAALELFLEENNLSGKTKEDEEVLDALFGDYSDGNELEADALLKKDESMEFAVVPVVVEADEKADAEAAEEKEVEFYLTFALAGDEETEYTLHVLPTEAADVDLLISDDGYAYIEYKIEGSEEVVSTMEQENDLFVESQARTDYSNFATYGDDGGYGDYGDYSYAAPAADYSYAAPAYEDTSWINAAQGADDCADFADTAATW